MMEEKKKNKKVSTPKKQTKDIKIDKKELELLKAEAQKSKEYADKFLRLQAEFENTRKRMAKEHTEFVKYANEELMLQILPVIDNFKRAVESVSVDKNKPEIKSIVEGITMIEKQLEDVLTKNGLIKIKSVGEKFNPHLHEAIATVETEDFPEDTVIEELQIGYMLKDRLIRPAVVKVAK